MGANNETDEVVIERVSKSFDQLTVLKSIDLKVKAIGDTHIDLHHTTEDTGIAIGECL